MNISLNAKTLLCGYSLVDALKYASYILTGISPCTEKSLSEAVSISINLISILVSLLFLSRVNMKIKHIDAPMDAVSRAQLCLLVNYSSFDLQAT